MLIGQIHVENVKRAEVVSIDTEGKALTVGGDNEQGKSSFLDGVFYALKGKGAQAQVPIRQGADKAMVEVTLIPEEGEEPVTYTVNRTITAKRTHLTITKDDGTPVSAPQTFLDMLQGDTFDMDEFSEKSGPEQREILLKLDPNSDPTAIDDQYSTLYKKRTALNTKAKGLIAARDAIPWISGIPDEEIKLTDLTSQLQAVQEQHADVRIQKAALDANVQRSKEMERSISALQDSIIELENQLKRKEEEAARAETELSAFKNKLEVETTGLKQRESSLPNLDSFQQAIDSAEETNTKIRSNQQRLEYNIQIAKLKPEKIKIESEMEALKTQRAEMIKNAKYPVPGLDIVEDGITFNGLPFKRDQLSAEEILRVSIAIGAKACSGLKAMVIKEGCKFDSKHRQMAREIALEHGVQLIMEIVGSGDPGECQLVMEEGHGLVPFQPK